MSTERADYLDTQTLSGGEGYFHTENAPTHATDGSATGASEETALVAASRGAAASDDYESWKNADLIAELERQGKPLPERANKANLVAALRA